MKILIYLLLLFSFQSYGQNNNSKKVKIRILLDKNRPIISANIYVLGSNPPNGTQTDLNGNAELTIESESDYLAQISFISPYSPILDIPRKTDSIFVNYNTKTATYYCQKRKIKKSKMRI